MGANIKRFFGTKITEMRLVISQLPVLPQPSPGRAALYE